MDIVSIKQQGIKYLNHKRVRQVLMLFSVNLITIPIGIVTSIVLTNYLGTKGYGDYQFLNNVFTLSVTIFIFGFFQAGNRMLVLNKDKQKAREYYGAIFIILILLFLIMSSVLTIYALTDSNIREKGLANILIYLIPFSWVYLLINYFEVLFQADNRMNLLATSRLLPKLGFLLTAIIVYFFLMENGGDKLVIIWSFYLSTQVVVFIYILFKLKLSFKNLKKNISEAIKYNKSYGFPVYMGSVFSVGTAQLTGVLISYFGNDNSGVGYFFLALTFATPLLFIPNTIATSNYKDFASLSRIPNKIIYLTIFLSVFSLLLLWIIVPTFINFFYGEEFQPVIRLSFIVSIGLAFHGMADFFNRFLGAHGLGKLLRNTSFVVGTSILALNFFLIPVFGEYGAAYTRLFGGAIYLACMFFYYKKNEGKEIVSPAN